MGTLFRVVTNISFFWFNILIWFFIRVVTLFVLIYFFGTLFEMNMVNFVVGVLLNILFIFLFIHFFIIFFNILFFFLFRLNFIRIHSFLVMVMFMMVMVLFCLLLHWIMLLR